MKKFSIITRKGILNVKGNSTKNQCAKEGHEVYNYELKVLFSSKTKLNENGWIIDHQHLDDAVQESIVNSCEIMSDDILNRVEKVLIKNNLKCVGIKLKIQPMFVVSENSAFFQEHRCHNVSDLPTIIAM